MLRINYAESSFVIRGMSEGASCTGKKKIQNKPIKIDGELMKIQALHQFSVTLSVISSPVSLWARLTCVAIDAEAIAEAEERKPVSPPCIPSLGTWR